MKIITWIYTAYAIIIFLILAIVFIPTMLILCQKKSWHHLALRIHNIWSWSLFLAVFIRIKVIKKFNPDPRQQYIYCANHFSYLDIPALLLQFRAKFIGKSSLTKIPLFGYFYRKIHITVNRVSVRSRGESLKKAKAAIDDQFSVAFFPEGGVKVKEEELPGMVPFQNGAFILSTEKNIPILPVTMPYNFRILPDKFPFRLHRHPCVIVIHEPVFPKTNTEEEVLRMKNEVYHIIQAELNEYHANNVQPVK